MMKRIFRGRLGRSQSKGRIIETAFVSHTQSSTEDLDEVDRLANHPVLRPNKAEEVYKLRKSRSETDRGLWPSSNNSSPMGGTSSGFGRMLRKRAKKPISRMKRSYTVDFAAAQAESGDDPGKGSPDISEEIESPVHEIDDVPVRRSSNVVTAAIIETSRDFLTPSPKAKDQDISELNATEAPNSAPLPAKFANEKQPPQNLLRLQLAKKMECDTSSAASTVSPIIKETKKLVLPLKQRLNLEDEDSSSSDQGTPKKQVEDAGSKPKAPLLGRKMQLRPRFIESESCSSAMSSLESVRSSNSSMSSAESGAGMSSSSNSNLSIPVYKPTLELRSQHRLSQNSKFQILSPISDKSQEQSEQGESKTPKVSPTDHILTSCCGVSNTDDSENNNYGLKEVEPAPFSMPKLQQRMIQHNLKQLKKANSGIQGSDSGISMSSQDVQDMVELLKLPFDMPKLRRKTQHILRPQSLPGQELIVARNSNTHYQRKSDFLEWPGPKPSDLTGGSTVDNFSYFKDELNNEAKAESGNAEGLPHPAPPPGFADENNQFYLTEDMAANETEGSNTALAAKGSSSGMIPAAGNLSMRRRKTKMTLSFGIDPKEKTLMFTTETAFLLNDCQEIDPNLPLERQEWYHGGISKAEAEDSLRHQEEGSYLVRNVDIRRQEFSLILKSAKGFMHMRIKRDANSRQFMLSDFSRTFLTIPDMVHHYTRNRLPIRGAEHMCLKKPVHIQLL